MREYIASGTSKEEFIRRLGKSIPSGAPQQNQASPVPATVPAQSQQSAPSQPSHATDSLYDDEAQPTVASANSLAPAQPPAPSVEEEGEEGKRFTAEQKGKSKARTEAEEEARRRVDERCGCEPPNPEKAHANEIKLRKQQVNEERKRILKRIEDDKRARKEREAAERKERLQQQSSTDMNPEAADGSDGTQISSSLRERKPQAGTGDHCNLQIRLLDGTTIRNRFTSDATLGSEVRKWVNSTRTDGNTPYSFRVVLIPRPNKIVQPQEELKSLLSLGLSPSATLVLIPNNNKYRAAYVRGGGIFGALVGVFSTLFGGILASLGGFFSFFFGGGASGSAGSSGIGGGRTGQSDDVPMENLRARRRDPQFYNGNSVRLRLFSAFLSRRIHSLTHLPTLLVSPLSRFYMGSWVMHILTICPA